MEKIFIVLLMTVWSNGEPEIIQYGTSVLGESFASRKECEDRLTDLAVEPDLTKEKGISGIIRENIVYRSRDSKGRIDQEYSCLEVNFQR